MKRCRSAKGFTLVEVVVVVMILGILAGVAAPTFLGVAAESEAASVLTTVTTIMDAAQRYSAEHGSLPPDGTRGVAPPELADYLDTSVFDTTTAMGGLLKWEGPGTSQAIYGVSIRFGLGTLAENRDSYRAMERMADDQSNSSGWITAADRHVFFKLSDNPSGGASVTPAPPVGGS